MSERPQLAAGHDAVALDSERLIGLIIRDLEGVVLPAVTDGTARFTGAILVKLLHLLKMRSQATGLDRKADEAARRLSSIAMRLLGPDESGADQQVNRIAAAAIPALRGYPAEKQAFWQAVIDLAEQRDLHNLGGMRTSLSDSYAESGSGDAKKFERQHHLEGKLEASGLVRYLESSMPDWAPVEVLEFREVGTGSQKSIFFATVQTAQGRFEWALRQDKAFSSFRVSVVDELPLLAKAYAAGLPVPKPVWLTEQGLDVGWAVCATERLTGSANYAEWAKNRVIARPIAEDVGRTLARLHAVDPGDLPQPRKPLPGTIGATAAARVAHLNAFWKDIGYADPVVDTCLAWLRTEAPEHFSRLALVHGDFAFHNLLIADGRLTGVLDWEFAHVGDPIEDLIYIRPFLDAMDCWDVFIGAYGSEGGIDFDERAARYWGVFNTVRLAIGSFHNIQAVRDDHPDLDIRTANSGYLYAGRLIADAAKLIAAA